MASYRCNCNYGGCSNRVYVDGNDIVISNSGVDELRVTLPEHPMWKEKFRDLIAELIELEASDALPA